MKISRNVGINEKQTITTIKHQAWRREEMAISVRQCVVKLKGYGIGDIGVVVMT